jgi:hypothetical protein
MRLDGDVFVESDVRRSSFALHLLGGSTLWVTHIAAGTTTGADQKIGNFRRRWFRLNGA